MQEVAPNHGESLENDMDTVTFGGTLNTGRMIVATKKGKFVEM